MSINHGKTVKLNLASKYTHWPVLQYAHASQFPHNSLEWKNLLTALSLKANDWSSMCSMLKVMGPWPAPCQKSNDHRWRTNDQKRSVERSSDISNLLLFHHSATPQQFTLKAHCSQIWGAASTVQQCCTVLLDEESSFCSDAYSAL